MLWPGTCFYGFPQLRKLFRLLPRNTAQGHASMKAGKWDRNKVFPAATRTYHWHTCDSLSPPPPPTLPHHAAYGGRASRKSARDRRIGPHRTGGSRAHASFRDEGNKAKPTRKRIVLRHLFTSCELCSFVAH